MTDPILPPNRTYEVQLPLGITAEVTISHLGQQDAPRYDADWPADHDHVRVQAALAVPSHHEMRHPQDWGWGINVWTRHLLATAVTGDQAERECLVLIEEALAPIRTHLSARESRLQLRAQRLAAAYPQQS